MYILKCPIGLHAYIVLLGIIFLVGLIWIKLSKEQKERINELYFKWIGYYDELTFYNISLASLIIAFHYREALFLFALNLLRAHDLLTVVFGLCTLLPFTLFLIFSICKSLSYAFSRASFYHNAKNWEKLALLFYALLIGYGIMIPAGMSALEYLLNSKALSLGVIISMLPLLYSGLKGLAVLSSLRMMKEEHLLRLLKPYNAKLSDILICTFVMLFSYIFSITFVSLPADFVLADLYKIAVALGTTQIVEAYLKR